MANPLKVLVDLQARRKVAVSGTLEVTGSTTLAGLTAGTTGVGALTATGVTVNGNVSGSGTLQVGGNTLVTSLTASSVISGTAGHYTSLFVNGVAVSTGGGGGSGTVNAGLANNLAFYPSDGTTVDDTIGLSWDNTAKKLAVSGATATAVALEVTGAVVVTHTLSSNGVSVTGNISGSGTLQAGGALTVGGAAALNGGLTSTTISGSGALQVGSSATIANNLTVSAGTTAVQVLTATTISGSSTLQAGGALTVAGASALNGGVTSTTISASSTIEAGGAITTAGDVAVNGGDLTTTAATFNLINSNATTVNFAGTADTLNIGKSAGTVIIKGNLTVQGTTTQVDSTTVNIGDLNISLGTGSTTLAGADGAGFSIGSGSLATFQYNHGSTSFKSTENLNVASGKVYKINDVEVLSSTALGNNVVASSLTSVGTLTSLSASGHTAISTLSASAISGTTGTFTSLAVNGATVATQTAVATATQNAYRALRFTQTGSLDGVNTVEVNLTTLGGSSFADTQKDYVSVNVMVRSGSANNWQNDLVAVHLSSSGGNLFVLIDSLGNDMDGYRLIAVNERDDAYSVTF